MKTYIKSVVVAGSILASVVILSISQPTQASNRDVPPVPLEVQCEMSGHDVNTPENVSCVALLEAFPPLDHASGLFHHAVVRVIDKGNGTSKAECILIGIKREMVRCKKPKAIIDVSNPEGKNMFPNVTLIGDGKSFDTAIFFKSVTDMSEYILLEYLYLIRNGQNSLKQSLLSKAGNKFDVHETETGKIYFRLPEKLN